MFRLCGSASQLLRTSWEPQHWIFAPGMLAIVRVEEGLLCFDRKGRRIRLISLKENETLAGIYVSRKVLWYLVQRDVSGADTLILRQARWVQTGTGYELSERFSVESAIKAFVSAFFSVCFA